MATERKFVRIKEKGQITLPTELRRRFGLETGDMVAVMETPEGVLIAPRRS